MKKVLFASDLDNTLLFSRKHWRETDRCVEYLEGEEQGFFTRRTLELLPLVAERTRFVPVTTRSVAQYRRIIWPEGCAPRYVVAANGGILLDGGEMDPEWYARTETLAAPWRGELLDMRGRLEEVAVPKRVRMVDGIYLFAACDSREDAQTLGSALRDGTGLDVAVSGRKVYFFPPPVNKGAALRRLQERFGPDWTVCAGDSVIDVPMLSLADAAIIPDRALLPEGGPVRIPSGGIRFPDFVLGSVLHDCETDAP